MVNGKLKKFLEENILYSQPFILDNEEEGRTVK